MIKKVFSIAILAALTPAFGQFVPPSGSTYNDTVMFNKSNNKLTKPTWSDLVEANVSKLTFSGSGLTNGSYDTTSALTVSIDKAYFDSLYMPLYPTQVKISSSNTIAGTNSLAVGTSNGGAGSNAMVAGIYNTIDYNVSAAIGSYLTTNRIGQVVIGTYNQSDAAQVFIVGQGTSSARKNIFTIDTTGNVISAGDYTNALNYTLKQTLQVNYDTKKVINDADARKFKDNNTIGDYSGSYVFVDTYGGGAVPYEGVTNNYINAPTTRDWSDWGIKYASFIYNATLTTVGAQSINGSFANTITDAASTQNAVLTPIVSGNVNANTLAVQNFRIQNTSYPITGTFSLTESGGSTATEYSGSLTAADGRIAMDLLSGKFTGNLSGTQKGTYANTINANTELTGNLAIPVNSASRLFLQGVASTNVQNAYKYVSEYFTDLVLKVISPDGEILYCMTTYNFNSTPLTTLYPTKVDRNAKVYYYTNDTIVNGSGKTVEAPKKAWDYVNGQIASNSVRYWSIGQYETLGGNVGTPYYKVRITGIEIFPDMSQDWVREAFADPRNTIKVWRNHGVYGAEYVGIRNNDPTYKDSSAPIWRPAKIFYTKPATQD